MHDASLIQGRRVTDEDVCLIRRLLRENPAWHRTQLSRELCRVWGWFAANGRLKDMACRSLLLKLQARGVIALPARRSASVNGWRNREVEQVPCCEVPIHAPLAELQPLEVEQVHGGESLALFRHLVRQYHYLGYGGTVGENLKYLVRNRARRPLACLLFGSAAWRTAPRDVYLGWDERARRRNLQLVTNNMRFLVLPWVEVPCLASHILGLIGRRIATDWVARYGHTVVLLETFVDVERFRGTCYRASNWLCVGRTRGRSRNDRHHALSVSPKDIYLYPLHRRFQRRLQEAGD